MMIRWIAIVAMVLTSAGCTTEYAFDDVRVGPPESSRTPRPRSNAQFVRSLYADLMGRAPEAFDFVITSNGSEVARIPLDEQSILVGTLDGVGDPGPMRAIVANALVHSDEIVIPAKGDISDPEEFIRDQFRHFLGREPNVYELRAFVAEWNNDDAVTPTTIIRALIGSREYQSY